MVPSIAGLRKEIVIALVVLGAVFIFTGLAAILWRLSIRRRRYIRTIQQPATRYSCSLRKLRRERSNVFDPSLVSMISMTDLAKATDDFDKSRVIGDGGFGLVYRATMPDGRIVAVKKLCTDGVQGIREFEAEMETLGKIRHRNLIKLLAYCSSGDERLLVYEFVERGSLDSWLHEKPEGPQTLDWPKRLRIAQGSARGLSYLHHDRDPHVIHRDIKSSNILLDKDFEPRIADFGLARNMSPLVSHVTTRAAGTLGYMAPEYSKTLKATLQADVYSFGMMMLELATGRRPNVLVKERNLRTLAKWARELVEESEELELLDPIIVKQTVSYEQVAKYFRVACECIAINPGDRPTMRHVFDSLRSLGNSVDEVSSDQASAQSDHLSVQISVHSSRSSFSGQITS